MSVGRALRVGDRVACDDGLQGRVLGWLPRNEWGLYGERPVRHTNVVVELDDGTRRLVRRRRIVALVEQEPKR